MVSHKLQSIWKRVGVCRCVPAFTLVICNTNTHTPFTLIYAHIPHIFMSKSHVSNACRLFRHDEKLCIITDHFEFITGSPYFGVYPFHLIHMYICLCPFLPDPFHDARLYYCSIIFLKRIHACIVGQHT